MVAGGWVVAGGVAAAVAAVMVQHDLRAGLGASDAVLAAARRGDAAQVEDRLHAAHASFGRAHRTLSHWWFAPAATVPIVAQQFRAVRVAASAGDQLSSEVLANTPGAALSGVRLQQGGISLDRIQQLQGILERSTAELHQAARRLSSAKSPLLISPLAHRLDRAEKRLASAEHTAGRGATAARQARGLLGGDGTRRYFLAIQTPAELRATGGFIGNWGEITATGGKVSLTRFGRTADLDSAGNNAVKRLVAPADYVARYSRFDPQLLWQNVTMSPDFPSVAQVVEGLYPQSGGSPVDGVIAIDPDGLASVLQLTGPVTVPAWPEPISAANAHQVLLFDQYVHFQQDSDRVNFLGQVAKAAWDRLTSTTLPSVDAVVKALGPAVASKHLLLASTRPSEEDLFRSMGAAGAMRAGTGDFLGVVTQNAGGDKIDWFLRRSVVYRARLDSKARSLRATVDLTLRNDAPSSGLPEYIINGPDNSTVPPGVNKLYLSIYTPWLLEGAQQDGVPLLMESELERGLHVYSTYVLIPSRSSVRIAIDLSGRMPRGSYRLELFRQPTVAPDHVNATVAGPSRAVLSADFQLDRDTSLATRGHAVS